MSFPVNFSVSQNPLSDPDRLDQIDIPTKNYARTTWKLYELTDEQTSDLLRVAMGSGTHAAGNMTLAQRVTIRGETVHWVVRRGDSTRIVTPVQL